MASQTVPLNVAVNQQQLLSFVQNLQVGTKQAHALSKAVKGISAPLGRITNLNDFERSMSAATARVATFTATTSLLYGFSAAIRRLTSDAIKFEASFKRIQSITGQTDGELRGLSKTLFELANNAGVAYFDTAKAFEELSRQGLTVSKTIKATSAALAIAKLSGSDLKTTIDGLIASSQAYIDSGLGFDKIADKIIALDAASTSSASGIIQALSRVASVAEDTGFAFDTIAATITAVKQQTGATEAVVGNSLKTIITSLQSEKVRGILDGIGVSVKTATGEFRAMDEVIRELAKVFPTLTDSQKAFVGEKIAGKFQINRFRALLDVYQNGSVDKQVAVSQGADGSAQKRLDIITSSVESKLQKMQNSFTALAGGLSDNLFVPLITGFTESIGQAFKEVSKVEDILTKFFPKTDKAKEAGFSVGGALVDGLVSAISGPGSIVLLATIAKLARFTLSNFGSGASGLLFNSQEKKLTEQKRINDFINLSVQTGNTALLDRLGILQKIVTASQGLSAVYAANAGMNYSALLAPKQIAGLNKSLDLNARVETRKVGNFAGGRLPQNIINKEVEDAKKAGYSITDNDVKMARLKIDGRYQDVVFNKKESIIPTKNDTLIVPPNFALGNDADKNKRRDRYSARRYNRSDNRQAIGRETAAYSDLKANPPIPPVVKSAEYKKSTDKLIKSNNSNGKGLTSLSNAFSGVEDKVSRLNKNIEKVDKLRTKIPAGVGGIGGNIGATSVISGKSYGSALAPGITYSKYRGALGNTTPNIGYNIQAGANSISLGGTGGGKAIANLMQAFKFKPVAPIPSRSLPIPTPIRNSMPTSPFVPKTPLPPISIPGPFQQLASLGGRMDQIKAEQIAKLKESAEDRKYRLGAGSANRLVGSTLSKDLFSKEELKQQKLETRKIFQEKAQARNFKGALLAPFLAQMAIGATGNKDTKGGRIAGSAVEGLSSGLMLSMMIGGPLGVGIGALVGTVKVASTAIDEWSGSSKQSALDLQRFSESTMKTKNALDTYGNAFAAQVSLLNSGGSEAAIKGAVSDTMAALSQITDSAIRDQLVGADTQDKIAEVLRKFNFTALEKGAAIQGTNILRKSIDEKSGFLDKTQNYFGFGGKVDIDQGIQNEILSSIVSAIDFSSLNESDLSKLKAGDTSSIKLPKGTSGLLREIKDRTKMDLEPELLSKLTEMAGVTEDVLQKRKTAKQNFSVETGYEELVKDSINGISANFSAGLSKINLEIALFKKSLEQNASIISEVGKLENDYYINKKEREIKYFEETQKQLEKLPTELIESISGLQGGTSRLDALQSIREAQVAGNFAPVIERIKKLNDPASSSNVSNVVKDALSQMQISASALGNDLNLMSSALIADKAILRQNQIKNLFDKRSESPNQSGYKISNGIAESLKSIDKKSQASKAYRSGLGPKSNAEVARETLQESYSKANAIIEAQEEKVKTGMDYKSIFPLLTDEQKKNVLPALNKDKKDYTVALADKGRFDQQKIEEPILAGILDNVNSRMEKITGRKNNIDIQKYIDMYSSGNVSEIIPNLDKSLVSQRGVGLKDLGGGAVYDQLNAFSTVSVAKGRANFEGAMQKANEAFAVSDTFSGQADSQSKIDQATAQLKSQQDPLIASQSDLKVSIDALSASLQRHILIYEKVKPTVSQFENSPSGRILDQATADQGRNISSKFNEFGLHGVNLGTPFLGQRMSNILSDNDISYSEKQQKANALLKEFGGADSVSRKVQGATSGGSEEFNTLGKEIIAELKAIESGRITASTNLNQTYKTDEVQKAISDLEKMTKNLSTTITHDVSNQVTIEVNGLKDMQQKTQDEVKKVIEDRVKQIVIDLLGQNGIVVSEKPKS